MKIQNVVKWLLIIIYKNSVQLFFNRLTYPMASLVPVNVHCLSTVPLDLSICILQPDSDCNLVICSPPLPITM